MEHTPGFLKLVKDAKSRVREADFREIKRRLDAREKLVLVDVREDSRMGPRASAGRHASGQRRDRTRCRAVFSR